ncbi:MAG: A/G-specific adenine glycosylase [Phycisphaerales bacterium JB043]
MNQRDRRITSSLERWFDSNKRELAWRQVDARTSRRNAWASFVSEVMLQQTQVARVEERFGVFMERFPTPGAMACADEDAVVAMWSGMGYYRRARNLHRAAVEITERFGGRVPSDVAELRSLPGIGDYTAGAIASVVFGAREPIVDANVARVVLRLEGRELAPSSREGRELVWRRARELVESADRPGVFNEGMMELGALVCTNKSARCNECPLRAECESVKRGIVGLIPVVLRKTRGEEVVHASVVMRDTRGRVLLERRDASGLWGGMWQAPTVERASRPRGVVTVLRELKLAAESEGARRCSGFVHGTSSRDVRFVSWALEGVDARRVRARDGRGWFEVDQIADLGLGSPQLRVLRDAGVFD